MGAGRAPVGTACGSNGITHWSRFVPVAEVLPRPVPNSDSRLILSIRHAHDDATAAENILTAMAALNGYEISNAEWQVHAAAVPILAKVGQTKESAQARVLPSKWVSGSPRRYPMHPLFKFVCLAATGNNW